MPIKWLAAGLASLALSGCAPLAATPEARARVAAAQPNSPDGQTIKPVISRTIIGPEGNAFQCTGYPGGVSGEVCVQR